MKITPPGSYLGQNDVTPPNVASGGGGGGVTSVDLTMPAEFSVAGGPVTSSGTLAVTKATQAANKVWAGPASGSAAAPSFRSLVAADLGSIGLVKIGQVVASGSPTKLSFTSIPQGYTDLVLVVYGRDISTSAGEVAATLQINADATAGNYSSAEYMVASVSPGPTAPTSGSVGATTQGVTIGIFPGTNLNGSAVGMSVVTIPSYTNLTFPKIVNQDLAYYCLGANSIRKGQQQFIYFPHALPVTQLDVWAFSGWATSSVATLYGRG